MNHTAFLDAVMFSSYYDVYVTDKLINMAVIKRTGEKVEHTKN
jgi:hypothetical protein